MNQDEPDSECFRCGLPLVFDLNYNLETDMWTCPACGFQSTAGISDPRRYDEDDDGYADDDTEIL